MIDIVISTKEEAQDKWVKAFSEFTPHLSIIREQDLKDGDKANILYAVVESPSEGLLSSLPNLKAIFNLWAGVDRTIQVKDFPFHIPFYRMVDEGLTEGMCEYVIGHIFKYHLKLQHFQKNQNEKYWQLGHVPPLAKSKTVGILGIGVIGQAVAQNLLHLNFNVRGWSRTKKNIPSVKTFIGNSELNDFLKKCDYLVSLLPSTAETENIINAKTLGVLPQGCYIINAGRGNQVCDADLIDALDKGQLSGATLDVFRIEPLPADHPFWYHDKIDITPHIASLSRLDTSCLSILQRIEKLENGETVTTGLFNPEVGY